MDDLFLWKEFTKGIKKLDAKQRASKSPPDKVSVTPNYHRYVKAPPGKEVKLNNIDGIDAATRKKIDKGAREIDATLDLHGYNAQESYVMTLKFINKAYAQGHRLCLIITGKGDVLRKQLVVWLNHDEIRGKIVRFSQAAAKHGGQGAFYIYLRNLTKS